MLQLPQHLHGLDSLPPYAMPARGPQPTAGPMPHRIDYPDLSPAKQQQAPQLTMQTSGWEATMLQCGMLVTLIVLVYLLYIFVAEIKAIYQRFTESRQDTGKLSANAKKEKKELVKPTSDLV
ncbi:hypothetical protein Mp_3g11210 [Marchantia polymorpha subsp. ruderalis]|uniref:Uncharacterized protein n=2 Tax=Marchantia polymorpha TaxID=3197 RepID=A0AAF6AZM1_MARPO|nr:hypothetical protein MARPO_0037s0076 [Marchantia polymorpha]BBN05205.1 hypothetical protein Mp_3g11210 [Marchantia polymorpha subsp. ruderalis]|eukprot:PTQ40900.1 hypothetical protein MARPO_0037s0076 [Marchantia polymorpha]